MSEQVNHPQHYGGEENLYEAIKVIEDVTDESVSEENDALYGSGVFIVAFHMKGICGTHKLVQLSCTILQRIINILGINQCHGYPQRGSQAVPGT